jgi:hypothetical protein
MDGLQDTKYEEKSMSLVDIHVSDFTLRPEPHIPSTSSISSTIVSDIQFTARLPLFSKKDVAERVDAARLAGADHFMSSTASGRNMHQFLNILLHLVARPAGCVIINLSYCGCHSQFELNHSLLRPAPAPGSTPSSTIAHRRCCRIQNKW